MLVGDCALPGTAARAGDFIFAAISRSVLIQPEFRSEICSKLRENVKRAWHSRS